MDYLEIVGTAVGLIYLWLEYRASVWLWLAGIIMPAIYVFVYYDAGLYADAGISVYYLLASVYGWVCWLIAGQNQDEKPDAQGISHTPVKLAMPLTIIVIGLTLAIGTGLKEFTDSTVPWADGFTTALSIVAMWMLAKKYVEQWLVWIVADVTCSALYVYKGLYFTGGLYGLYAAIAVAGYRKWLHMMK